MFFSAKSNNQKSKSGAKRPTQSKMRPDKKEPRSVEAEAPVTEISPSPTPPVPNPAVVINSEKPEEIQVCDRSNTNGVTSVL